MSETTKILVLIAFGFIIGTIGFGLYWGMTAEAITPLTEVTTTQPVAPDIPIGPVQQKEPWYPSAQWFAGIMFLETGGDPNAFLENPFQIEEPFWYEGMPEGEHWDYVTYRHNIPMCTIVIENYFAKYGIDNDCVAAMVFRRGPTGSGWKYWKALERKMTK